MFTKMPEQWTDPATHVYFTQKEVDAMVKAVNDMGLLLRTTESYRLVINHGCVQIPNRKTCPIS